MCRLSTQTLTKVCRRLRAQYNQIEMKHTSFDISPWYSMYSIYNVFVYIILYLWRRQFAGFFCRLAWLKRVESIKTSCHFSLSVRLNYEISFFLSCYWFIHCQKIFIVQCPCVCYDACACVRERAFVHINIKLQNGCQTIEMFRIWHGSSTGRVDNCVRERNK